MSQSVLVIRNSKCGNGNDDPGQVLAVFFSPESAYDMAKQLQQKEDQRPIRDQMEVDVEGPFVVEA